MRAFGHFYSALADLTWLVTVAIFGFIVIFPGYRLQEVPLYGRSVMQLFTDFGYFGLIWLFVINALSGRFGPPVWQKTDHYATLFAFLGLCCFCTIVFIIGYGRDGLPSGTMSLLLATTGFSIYDLFVQQGEQWRSRELLAEQAHETLAKKPVVVMGPHHEDHVDHDDGVIAEIDIPDESAERIAARIFTRLEPMLAALIKRLLDEAKTP